MSSDKIIDALKNGITTSTPEATLTTAANLALVIPANTTLAFYGDLGAGKTTFIRYLESGELVSDNPIRQITLINQPWFLSN